MRYAVEEAQQAGGGGYLVVSHHETASEARAAFDRQGFFYSKRTARVVPVADHEMVPVGSIDERTGVQALFETPKYAVS